MNFIIKYGTKNCNNDVTNIVYNKCNYNNIIFIPSDDQKRGELFGDPVLGILKSIIIYDKIKDVEFIYDAITEIFIDLNTNMVYTDFLPYHIKNIFPNNSVELRQKLISIHNNLKLDYGVFIEEYPEQKMVVKYLTGNEKILELGSNIGRNTLVMSYLLQMQNSNSLVSLESDSETFKLLKHNIEKNKMKIYIENSALSKRKLIQNGWNTICSDILLPNYKNVNIITLDELYDKYQIKFDTLLIDCEGAFYYILQDMPEILNNINLVIMENDYNDLSHKQYIDSKLIENNLKRVFVEEGGFGPCKKFFYEVWKK